MFKVWERWERLETFKDEIQILNYGALMGGIETIL